MQAGMPKNMTEEEFKAKLKTYRLNEVEYGKIYELLGRDPRPVEWALFSALWSEHCSYKSSKIHLKKLFNKSSRVVESFGENAGVVDLGGGERVAFKIESHNHPSFIEPYQGAATGVGGILRDIFTMGARPVALADYLCFGRPTAPRMSQLVDGVVRGIGGYGNCVGVPTITGQTEFHESYDNNILVNAMAVGLFRPGEKVYLSKAKGAGNWIVYVGAKTGRDGVHGASMASESFEADSASKRPTVQIGDPFFEKLLIESCLEVMKEDLVVAIQDMGAAGLTSSSFEMASKGGVGFRIELDKVPLRDSSMSPEDILLSESQERMLLVCEPAKFERIAAIFHRWNLDAVKIGEVTTKKTVELHWK
ncbi:MAG: AIR synthase-related protein, partial [Bdellovibrionota bacterium]